MGPAWLSGGGTRNGMPGSTLPNGSPPKNECPSYVAAGRRKLTGGLRPLIKLGRHRRAVPHLAQSAHCSLPFALLVSPASSTSPISATGGVEATEPFDSRSQTSDMCGERGERCQWQQRANRTNQPKICGCKPRRLRLRRFAQEFRRNSFLARANGRKMA